MKRIHFVCLEDMVPKNHLLRAIEQAIDWSFIYDEVKGKKALKPKNNDDDNNTSSPTKTVTESTTDPECGLFHKGEHEKQFAYASNTACDRNGFVLDFEVTPANLHDSVTFDDLYKRIATNYPETDAIAVDAGYKTPYIMKLIFESGKIP